MGAWNRDQTRTLPNGVRTSEGFIPHLRAGGVSLPVALCVVKDGIGQRVIFTSYGKPVPKRVAGKLVRVLPGGREVVQ